MKVVKPPPVLTLSVKPQRKAGGALGEGEQTTVLKQGFRSKKRNGNSKIRIVVVYPLPTSLYIVVTCFT